MKDFFFKGKELFLIKRGYKIYPLNTMRDLGLDSRSNEGIKLSKMR